MVLILSNYRKLKYLIAFFSPVKKWIETVTTDNGMKFSAHEIISKALGVEMLFANSYFFAMAKRSLLKMRMV